MDGKHTHKSTGHGGLAVVAIVLCAAIAMPVVGAAVAGVIEVIKLILYIIAGIVAMVAVGGFALVWRHGWPGRHNGHIVLTDRRAIPTRNRYELGDPTGQPAIEGKVTSHGNRRYRTADSLANRRKQGAP
jgi:hypothetical protein